MTLHSALDWLYRTGRALSYDVLPDRCCGCDTPLDRNLQPHLCNACWASITPLQAPLCPCCGRPFPSPIALEQSPTHLCGPCRTSPPAYHLARSLYAYASPLREAIHAFKYRHNLALGRVLERLFLSRLPSLPDIDCVMPVPLAPDRLREREYNQALLLAKAAADALDRPLDYWTLHRLPGAPPQTSLPRQARLQNLRRKFQVRSPLVLQDRRILLVDDVLTTGTTVNECAKALRKAGSGDVTVVTLARAVPH